jgi:hypothetical protein
VGIMECWDNGNRPNFPPQELWRAGTFPPLTLALLFLPGRGLPDRRLWQPELRMWPALAVIWGILVYCGWPRLATYAASGKSQPSIAIYAVLSIWSLPLFLLQWGEYTRPNLISAEYDAVVSNRFTRTCGCGGYYRSTRGPELQRPGSR